MTTDGTTVSGMSSILIYIETQIGLFYRLVEAMMMNDIPQLVACLFGNIILDVANPFPRSDDSLILQNIRSNNDSKASVKR